MFPCSHLYPTAGDNKNKLFIYKLGEEEVQANLT